MKTNHIIKLPPALINQIAAGEVVERPSSIVKELIENSIDAGATNIKILLEKSGIQKIVIIDNGHGMSKSELATAVQTHTTSKIKTVDDLMNINTFGFRGEALASTAQVSEFEISSQIKTEPLGNKIIIDFGKTIKTAQTGMTPGTKIVIKNLFKKIPARKKFLKSPQTELRHVLDKVISTALAHPEISFTLKNSNGEKDNNKRLLFLPQQTLNERIKIIFGNDFENNLLKTNIAEPHFGIKGFISHPQIARGSNHKQFLFVNNRKIKNKIISSLIKNIYGSLLTRKAYPPFILYITMPTESVDVNVHPRKEEVRFSDKKIISKLIEKAVTQSLQKHDLLFSGNNTKKQQHENNPDFQYNFSHSPYTHYLADSANLKQTSKILKKSVKPWITKEYHQDENTILQINNLYLARSTDNGMLLIDQHAAHERILYEQFLDAFEKESKNSSIKLKKPITFELSISEKLAVESYTETFKKMGFSIKTNTDNSLTITKAPRTLVDRTDIANILKQIIDDLINDNNPKQIDELSHKLIQFLACRTAIKAGEYLEPEERVKLWDRLKKCEKPYTCPHGRPTEVLVGVEELERMFRRR